MNKIIAASKIIDSDAANKLAEDIGNKLAWMFQLKKDAEHKDRFKMATDTKRPAGVARVFFRLLQEAGRLNTDPDKNTLNVVYDNAFKRIAEEFNLKKDKEHPDRVQTAIGTKTAIGLIGTAEKLILEEIDNLPDELVIKSESEHGFWSNEQGWVFDVASATKFNLLNIDNPLVGFLVKDDEVVNLSNAVDFDMDGGHSPS